MIKQLVFLFFISLLLFSCKKEEAEFPNIPKEGKYITEHIWVTPSIDLNRDGVKSADLLDETHWLQFNRDFILVIHNRPQQNKRFLDIVYPYLYTDINDLDFVNPGTKALFSDFEVKGNKLITENPAILSAILLNDSTIEITSVAEFELLEGKKEVEMKSVYTWNSL